MIRILASLTLGFMLVSPALACNVPVFRYSLERWQPDRYEMVVIQRGPLSVGDKGLVDSLSRQAEKCNLAREVALIDVDKIGAEDREKLVKRYGIMQYPWAIIRYPDHVVPDGPAYSGPLEAKALQNLLDSPSRAELARRLLRGESAVWLLLESGDAKADDAVEAKLKTWLGGLEKTLKLPELSNSSKDKLLREDLPLKMSFSILRVSRAAAAEKHFVHILRHMEKDLSGRTEPMVIPVFGRGLALYAIVGKGITEGNIEDASRFLTGACSCEVKQLNPGVDLLMTVDWDGKPAPVQVQKPIAPGKSGRVDDSKPGNVPVRPKDGSSEKAPGNGPGEPSYKKSLPVPPSEKSEPTAPSSPPKTVSSPSSEPVPLQMHTRERPDASSPTLFGRLSLLSGAVLLCVAIGLYVTNRFRSNKM